MNATARVAFVACIAAVIAAGFLPWRLQVLRYVPWREGEHCAAFFVLTCGAALSFPKVRLSHIVLIGMAFGAAMELAQATSWVGRHGALTDWIADALGAGVVLMVASMAAFRQSHAAPGRSTAPAYSIPDRRVRLARADRLPGR